MREPQSPLSDMIFPYKMTKVFNKFSGTCRKQNVVFKRREGECFSRWASPSCTALKQASENYASCCSLVEYKRKAAKCGVSNFYLNIFSVSTGEKN